MFDTAVLLVSPNHQRHFLGYQYALTGATDSSLRALDAQATNVQKTFAAVNCARTSSHSVRQVCC